MAPDATGINAPRDTGRGQPDPGSRRAARLAGWAVLVLVVAVFFVQQLGESISTRIEHAGRKGAKSVQTTSAPVPSTGDGTREAPLSPPDTTTELSVRLWVRMFHALPFPQFETNIDQLRDSLVKAGDERSASLRMAVVHGEIDRSLISGPEERATRAREEVEKVLSGLASPDDPLRQDAEALRTLYSGGTLDAETKARLKEHHGYIGSLAGVYDAPDGDPRREELTGNGAAILVLFFGFVAIGLMALCIGLALLIVYLVRRTGGTWRDRFVPPAPGGSVAIETVLVFVLGFLALKGVTTLAEIAFDAKGAIWVALSCQWLLLLSLFWPMVRGVPRSRCLRMFGLHRGQGIAREMWCGLLGYLACLPMIAAALVVTVVLLLVREAVRSALGQPSQAPQNPMFDLAGGGTLRLVVFYLLATLWAPIAEETIFRGALFRHLRSRWRLVPSAIVTGVAFGAMHGYEYLMLGPVVTIGFGFSLVRQWRDSLIGPMTAHCLHNAMTLAVAITLMRLV